MTRIELPVAGATLVGDLYEAAVPRMLFVVSHGWQSRRPEDIPAALARAGFTTLAYDLRGHGESNANLAAIRGRDWVEDLVAVVDHAHALVPGLPIGLVGASFGAWLSVLASARRPIGALSLRVPANLPDAALDLSVAELFESSEFRTGRSAPAGPEDSLALAALDVFSGPVQIVDADLDAIIPAQTIVDYVNVATDPDRHTLRNAPHHLATPELRAEYIEQLISWASRACSRCRPGM